MVTQVIMPKLGLTMVEGKIVEWKKNEGEIVIKGEILFVIETEKVTFEVEAPESGILGRIIAQVNDVIPVGRVVAYILQEGEKPIDALTAHSGTSTKSRQVEVSAIAEKTAIGKHRIPQDISISPLARRIAMENNIDISILKGTGPEGRIIKEDVLSAIEATNATATEPTDEEQRLGKLEPLSSMRKTIARRMVDSVRTAPHFWVIDEADTTEIHELYERLRSDIQPSSSINLTLTDLLIKVVSKALRENPCVNATWTDKGILILSEINVGIATSIPGGLVVPVIKHADEKSLADISSARVELVTKARQGKLNITEMTGGTFTLNNVGALGIKCVDAIINPSQSAILTVGRINDRAVAINGKVMIKTMMDMSLGVDHRVLDGASSGRFLLRIKELIEYPATLMQ